MSAHPGWSAYLPRSAVLRDSGLSCRGAGQQGARGPMTARRLSTYGLVFVTEGTGRFTGPPGEGSTAVVAPAVVWLFPGVEHRYDVVGRDWQEHWLLFEGVTARAYEGLRAWRQDRPVLRADPSLGTAIGPLFAALRRGLTVPGRRAELLGATLTHALIGIAAALADRPHDATPPGPVTDSPVRKVVASALTPASVAERAEQVGLSPRRLREQVTHETSLSVHELVIQARLARAQDLLVTTDMSVGAVGGQVGYDDPAYFSRLFRARIGVSPSTFRRQTTR